MRTLLVLRHAKSSHEGSEEDIDRPLNDRGRQDAPVMGRALRQLGLLPDRVLCSPAVRARQTAELFGEACGCEGRTELCCEIYLAEPGTLVELLGRQSTGEVILLVGHNPGLQELVALVTTGSTRGVRFPTGALARIDFDIGDWSEVGNRPLGELHWLLVPRLVRRL